MYASAAVGPSAVRGVPPSSGFVSDRQATSGTPSAASTRPQSQLSRAPQLDAPAQYTCLVTRDYIPQQEGDIQCRAGTEVQVLDAHSSDPYWRYVRTHDGEGFVPLTVLGPQQTGASTTAVQERESVCVCMRARERVCVYVYVCVCVNE